MPAVLPQPTILRGRHVVLEPLTGANAAELVEPLWRPETYAGGWAGGLPALPDTASGFVASLRRLWDAPATLPNHRPFLVRSGSGEAIGTTSLGQFDLAREETHLGWTAYTPSVWGTAVNPECKLLMLGHAFDNGFGRVRLQCDELNERSAAAIAALGVTYEGARRRDMKRADGSWRTTLAWAAIVDDWPQIRAGLEARLAG